jgi:hypothetical protein
MCRPLGAGPSRLHLFRGREPNLKPPIVDGAGQVVAGVQVVLGEFEVGLDHFHGAVAEQGLQDVAVAQELRGKGVPEAAGHLGRSARWRRSSRATRL